MSDCPSREQFILRVDGELSRNDELAMDRHLDGCARCRAEMAAFEGLVGALEAPATTAAASYDFAARALQADLRVARDTAQPTTSILRRWRGGWAGVVATSAAAAALFFVLRPATVTTETAGLAADLDRGFAARGAAPTVTDSKAESRRWVSLRVFRTRDGAATALQTSPQTNAGATLRPTDGLLFAYTNAGPAPFSHLAIYAVDQANHVYWYYPEFATEASDPVSIAISPGVDVELHDEVRHALAPGPLQVHAVFSNQPIRAHEIEKNPALEPAAGVRYTVVGQVE